MVAMSLICRDHVGWGELVWVSSYNIVLICSLIIFAHRVFDPLPLNTHLIRVIIGSLCQMNIFWQIYAFVKIYLKATCGAST